MLSRPCEHSAEIFVLLPEGRLDARAAPDLEQALAGLEAQNLKQIVVDLSQSRYISSSCLRLLLVHLRKLKQAGGDLKLCSLPDKVAKVLRIAGLDALFEIYPTVEQAARSFPDYPQEHG
jgi:anti-sigma B factor antagonist